MQRRITARGPLLDSKGRLKESGYATELVSEYNRENIKAGKLRIKEWDYYLITDGNIGIALTISDNAYVGLDSISFLNFEEGWEVTKSPMRVMTLGKTNLPPTSVKGNTEIFSKKYFLRFSNDGTKRILSFRMDNFRNGMPVRGEILLENPPKEGRTDVHGDTMVIAVPFPEKETAFYYNQKISCMPATGFVEAGGVRYDLDTGKFFGLLDWGRGVWTYRNTWYWGSASGTVNGKPFGFNIGYGFGDTSAASENMIFYDGVAHKLSEVVFNIPSDEQGNDDFMSPWTFTSDDGRFEMDFIPVMDRSACMDFKVLCSNQHQVFGRFTGKVVLDNGDIIEIKDFFGFAEKVFNKW